MEYLYMNTPSSREYMSFTFKILYFAKKRSGMTSRVTPRNCSYCPFLEFNKFI